jgi:hypothetical protein
VSWLVLSVIITLARENAQLSADRFDERGVDSVFGAEDTLSDHDLSVLSDLGEYVNRYNAASLPLITDYLDTDISAKAWVRSAARHIDDMRAAVDAMERDIESLDDDGARAVVRTFPLVLRDQLAAVIELRDAVARLDPRAERAAARHLRQATARRQKVGRDFLDRLSEYVDPSILQDIVEGAT